MLEYLFEVIIAGVFLAVFIVMLIVSLRFADTRVGKYIDKKLKNLWYRFWGDYLKME